MKNREKFREEIVERARTPVTLRDNLCEFIKKNVLPHFGEGGCDIFNCAWCRVLLDIWLDEEYIEPLKPEVNWSKVPVDTLVRVRDDADDEWYLRYFKGTEDSALYRFVTWESGATSITAYDSVENWKYCELVEDEDDCN